MSDERLPNRFHGAIDGALHLLDRQLLDCDGKMLGKVDDVELSELEDGLVVTAVLTGPAALLFRLGGRLGDAATTTWARLKVSEPDRTDPWRIDVDDLDRLDSALHLRVPRDGVLRRDGGTGSGRQRHRLGRLTGMDVVGPNGRRLGRVIDVRLAPGRDGRLVLRSLLVGHGRPGSLLGYDRSAEQGPWLVRAVVRRLHRHTRAIDVDAAEISWEAERVRVSREPDQAPTRALAG